MATKIVYLRNLTKVEYSEDSYAYDVCEENGMDIEIRLNKSNLDKNSEYPKDLYVVLKKGARNKILIKCMNELCIHIVSGVFDPIESIEINRPSSCIMANNVRVLNVNCFGIFDSNLDNCKVIICKNNLGFSIFSSYLANVDTYGDNITLGGSIVTGNITTNGYKVNFDGNTSHAGYINDHRIIGLAYIKRRNKVLMVADDNTIYFDSNTFYSIDEFRKTYFNDKKLVSVVDDMINK